MKDFLEAIATYLDTLSVDQFSGEAAGTPPYNAWEIITYQDDETTASYEEPHGSVELFLTVHSWAGSQAAAVDLFDELQTSMLTGPAALVPTGWQFKRRPKLDMSQTQKDPRTSSHQVVSRWYLSWVQTA